MSTNIIKKSTILKRTPELFQQIIVIYRNIHINTFQTVNKMKKRPILVSLLLGMAFLLPMQSCIGSFALTNKVISWNKQVGSKFINELVFFAFWILPVYEVTSIADLLVLNSIEFWSGNNPVVAEAKTIETEQGTYYIACDEKGYDITIPNGEKIRLDFDSDNNTWSVINDGEVYPFMTMVDPQHVKMITPDGDFRLTELSEEGLQAYMKLNKDYFMASL